MLFLVDCLSFVIQITAMMTQEKAKPRKTRKPRTAKRLKIETLENGVFLLWCGICQEGRNSDTEKGRDAFIAAHSHQSPKAKRVSKPRVKGPKEECKNLPTKRLEALAECGGYNGDTGTEYQPEAIHNELMRRYEEKSERELMDRIAALEAIDWEPMYDEEKAPTLEVGVDFETFTDSFQLCVVDAEALPFLARLKAIRGAMKSLFPTMEASQRDEWTGKLYASLLSNSTPLAA